MIVRRLSVCLLTLVLIVAFSMSPAFVPSASADDVGRGVGQAAPSFRLKDTNGKDVTQDAYRTKRYVVAFVSTTCAACQRTAALLLDRLAAHDDLTVIAIVCDPDRRNAGGPTPEVAARAWKVNVIGSGGPRDRFLVCPASDVVRRTWGEKCAVGGGVLKVVPTVVVVESAGRVAAVFEGEPTAGDLAAAIK